jgi:hypothetical protein
MMALIGCVSAVDTAKMVKMLMEDPIMYIMNAFMKRPLAGALAMSNAFF